MIVGARPLMLGAMACFGHGLRDTLTNWTVMLCGEPRHCDTDWGRASFSVYNGV